MGDKFYSSINKVVTHVFNINSEFALRHVVRVSHKSSDGRKELFHTEFTYASQAAYLDAKYLKTVKLNFNSYLMIEEINNKNWQTSESIFINNLVIYRFQKTLKKVRKWFYKYKDLYFFDDKNNLMLNKEVSQKLNIQMNINGKILVMQPTVIVKDDKEYEGVVIFINRRDCQCRITIDKLEALYYIIKKFDLYMAGLSIITYIGRPDTNMVNKDIGIESKKDDTIKYYKTHEMDKGMQGLEYARKKQKEKENQFSNYFK